ncbi:MAG: DUF4350 domain-containing protein [Arcicella sp.]|nr:DUF4350 domain-containing protein [Arcicella sp.]
MKQHRIYLVILLITIIGFILVEIYKPKPVDWTPTFSNKDKIPYGCELLYKVLPNIFPNQKISDEKVPIFSKKRTVKLPPKSNYLYVFSYFRVDSLSLVKLLDYVQKGNSVFIASENFFGLDDTLHFQTSYVKDLAINDSASINFINPTIRKLSNYKYQNQAADTYFDIKDSTKNRKLFTILGKNSKGFPNFIRVNFGKGMFFLNSVPMAFTNFYMVKNDNADYAFKALSYLPEQPIFWDEYVNKMSIRKSVKSISKSREAKGQEDVQESPFKFIVSQPALKWAYFITLSALLIYLIFEGKRRQRIIPIMEIPKNTSLQFVETIGSLYYNQKDHKTIAEKKITHFLAYIRTKFYLKTTEIDQEFKTDLSNKSGISLREINDLFDYISFVQNNNYIAENQLVILNEQVENFYKNV